MSGKEPTPNCRVSSTVHCLQQQSFEKNEEGSQEAKQLHVGKYQNLIVQLSGLFAERTHHPTTQPIALQQPLLSQEEGQ
jgi:hypothetical protein